LAYRVDLSGDARRDLALIQDWLTQPGAGRVAARKLHALDLAIRDLRQCADRWPVGDHAEVRERPTDGGYRLLYRILAERPGTVLILRIFGPYQDRSNL